MGKRTAEGKTREQVCWRDVELFVLTKDVHHFVGVDLKNLTDIPYFVGKSNLQCVPTVVDVLHHFGSFNTSSNQGCIELFIKLSEKASARPVEFADHGLRRTVKVPDSRSLTQKLRIMAKPKIDPSFLLRGLLQNGYYDVPHGAWQHRAADDDRVL